MDIQRYLDNEPIVARPPSKLYRFQKMARRNKLVFTAATAVAAALLLGIIGSTWQAVRAREQRERAEQEARRAEEATGKEQQERARAEAEAQKARSEADNLQRLLNYTSAGYMLSQGRLDEAYADIEKAIQSGANWEYGHLLGRIVSSSRDDWQLVMRAAIADRPSVGCFVGDETPYLVLAGDGGAKLFSVADGRLVSAGGPTDAIHLTGISGSRCAVATRGRKIIVYQLPDWRQLGTYESVDPIVYVKADAGGRWLGMLDAQATVTVLDLNDMHEAARRSFKPVVGETAGGQTSAAVSISPQAAIGFSPSGKQLLLNAGMPGKPTVVWDWPTDSTKVLSIVTEAAQIYAENRVVAYFALTLPSDFIRLSFHDLDRDATQAQSPRTVVLRELLAGGNQIFTAWGGPSAQGDIPDLRAALIIPDAINEIALRGDFTATSVARFGSLWPQAHDDLRFMAFDIPRQLLALSGSSGVLVFQFRERFPALSSTVPGRQLDPQWTNHPLASRDYATRYWSLGQTRDELIVCGASSRAAEERYSDVLRVSRINYETQADSPVYGEGPKPAEDRVMIPWGIASIPNGKILGILWQESSAAGGGGNIDSQYFRKAIAVYDLQQENSAENPLLPQRLIWLDDYAGIEGRSNRNFGLSPQGRTAIFCTTSGQTTGYRLQDGQKVYEFNAGRSYAVSPDASLFAGGDYAEPHPVQVWDVDTGKLVMSTSKTGLVRRMAFSADNQLLYVGWRSDLMDVFSVKDGSLVKEVKSSVAPVAVSPVGDRYVGILQDKNQPTSGSMVLASLGDGQTVLVLNPSAHILNNANFSSDGKSVAFIRNRTSVTLLTSFTSQEAERLLTHVEPMAVLNGQGTVTWPDGMKYVGEFRDGKMDGQGTLTWPQGRRYVGGFKDDKCDGQGVETRPNGTNLQEEWKDGQWYRVSGTLVYLDGTREVGTWNYDGTKSGGTITWKDGREYKGDWIVSDLGTEQPHGMGTMTWPDGRAYVGQFRYGKMEGKGRMTYSNGKVEDGVWRENQLAEATR